MLCLISADITGTIDPTHQPTFKPFVEQPTLLPSQLPTSLPTNSTMLPSGYHPFNLPHIQYSRYIWLCVVGAIVYYYVATSNISGGEQSTKRYGIAYFCGCILGFFYHIYNAFCGRSKRYVYDRVSDDEESELTGVNKGSNVSNAKKNSSENSLHASVASSKYYSQDSSSNGNSVGGGKKNGDNDANKKKKKKKRDDTALSSSKDSKDASTSKV